MNKIIKIGDKEITFASSAALPHMYRRIFKRDIFVDMDQLRKSLRKNKDGTAQMDIESMEMFENLAWCMAKHADPGTTDDIEEWLAEFETFDIYNLLPEIFAMWTAENKSTSTLKKRKDQPTVK